MVFTMPGKLYGQFFKFVVNSMLTASTTFPEYKKRIDEMKDTEWYDWDEYCKIVQDITNKLGENVIKNVGQKIISQSKPVFVQQGFHTPESILKDYASFFNASVKDTPPLDSPRTIEFAPGSVKIEAGDVQPRALIEGYLRGIIKMYGKRITKLDSETVGKIHKFDLEWN